MKSLALFSLVACWMCSSVCVQASDTVYVDDGAAKATNTLNVKWEESVILSPGAPCKIEKVQIYYASASANDTIRITGDASEGTIPPTQYCFKYNTLAKVVITNVLQGWNTIDVSDHDIFLGGYDRVCVQHLMKTGGPLWSMDAGQRGSSSFVYDPLTPNPNFLNIPGIYYLASGDYMVRLIVKYQQSPIDNAPATIQPPPQWLNVTTSMGLVNNHGAMIRSDVASVADIDGDGWEDISIGSMMFQNNKGQGFIAKSSLFYAANVVWADLDNDGDLDGFGANGNGADKFYRNNGNWQFADISSVVGLVNDAPTVTPLFLDYDHDGYLDLFIANGRKDVNGTETYFPDKLYRNNHNWTFTDVTSESKIALGEPAPYYDTWGASLTDFNNDGWTDIFVATYRLGPDRLYRNNKDGTFTEVSAQTGAIGVPTAAPNYYGHGMGSEWGDIDNDGDLDLAVGNLGHPDQRGQYSNPSLMLVNNGTPAAPKFENWYATSAEGKLNYSGLTFREMNAGMCFGDFNHDGMLDLWHGQISYEQYGGSADRPSRFYLRNYPNAFYDSLDRFIDATWQLGMFIHGAWTACRFDFDRDGDLDLLTNSGTHEVRLFRNDLTFGSKGCFVSFTLRGKPGTSPSPDISGSRVSIYVRGKQYHRWLPGTVVGGRSSQMSSELHFGFPYAPTIDSVVVHWPNGNTTKRTLLTANRHYIVSEDQFTTSSTLGVPMLLAPSNFKTGVRNQPEIRWLLADSTELQLSTSPSFLSDVISFRVYYDYIDVPDPLDSNTTYYWRARYRHGDTVGQWSSVWQFTVNAPRPPRPQIITPITNSTGAPIQLPVVWNKATMDPWYPFATKYSIKVTMYPVGMTVISDTGLVDTTFVCSLMAFQKYDITVRAHSNSIASEWSDYVTVTTYDRPPGISLALPENGSSSTQLRPRFQWNRGTWVDDGYEIQYDTLSDFSTAIVRERKDTLYPVVSALKAGKDYYWRVRGKNLVGDGVWSDTWTYTTLGTTSVDEKVFPAEWSTAIVYDVTGREVRRFDRTQEEHEHSVVRTGLEFIVFFDASGSPLGRRMQW